MQRKLLTLFPDIVYSLQFLIHSTFIDEAGDLKVKITSDE